MKIRPREVPGAAELKARERFLLELTSLPVAAGLATAEVTGQLLRLAFFGGLVALAVMLYRRRVAGTSAPAATS